MHLNELICTRVENKRASKEGEMNTHISMLQSIVHCQLRCFGYGKVEKYKVSALERETETIETCMRGWKSKHQRRRDSSSPSQVQYIKVPISSLHNVSSNTISEEITNDVAVENPLNLLVS
jgi:hypothetical protein